MTRMTLDRKNATPAGMPAPLHVIVRAAWVRPVLLALRSEKAEAGVNSTTDFNATFS